MKEARKVALINTADYPRSAYSAYWGIHVGGSDDEGYRWEAHLYSYEPCAWQWNGKVTPERPDMPMPVYPPDVRVSQAQYLEMTGSQKAAVRQAQDDRRAQCEKIYEAHPKPVHTLAEQTGVADTRDEADTAAQNFVLGEIEKYKRRDAGFALALGPLGMLAGIIVSLGERLGQILMAIAYSTVIRNERQQRVQVNIDLGAGAGLFRFYDGTRPATCGTATTLLAELTFTDPCAPSASGGVLTFSAITADSSANATGTATWYRNVDSTGTCCVDGNVGTAGSDCNLNSTSINTGVQVAVSSYTLTDGNA